MHQAVSTPAPPPGTHPTPAQANTRPDGGSPSLFSTNRVATRSHVGEHKRGRGVVFTTLGSTPTLLPLSTPRNGGDSATQQRMGAGQPCPAPNCYAQQAAATSAPTGSRTRQQAHTRA